MEGGKIQKIQDFGQFWPFWGFWGPVGTPRDPEGSPKGPLPLVLEVNHVFLKNIFKMRPIPGYWLNPFKSY